MPRSTHDPITTNPLSWNPSYSANLASTGDDEVAADVDEPPDLHKLTMSLFERTEIHPIARTSSLLTRAFIQSEEQEDEDVSDEEKQQDDEDEDDDEEDEDAYAPILRFAPQARRRSMASNISIASTAELTSDTGFTSPSRACTPSPPHPDMGILRIPTDPFPKRGLDIRPIASPMYRRAETFKSDAACKTETPKKRTISFACGNVALAQAPKPPVPAGLPTLPQPMVKAPSAQEAPRKPCIRFACPARPSSTQNTPPQSRKTAPAPLNFEVMPVVNVESPSTPKTANMATRATLSPKQSPPRRQSKSPAPLPLPLRRPKFLRATSTDLASDASHYHEFASHESREDDWIRREKKEEKAKITLDDIFVKENRIRRLGKEVEEEAELEAEQEAEAQFDEDNEDMDDEDEDLETVQDDEEDEEDEDDGYASDESDDSDGYHSDEETGFADSDDEEGGEDEPFWIPGHHVMIPGAIYSNYRRPSVAEPLSDASTTAGNSLRFQARPRCKPRRIRSRPQTPELPDSTDFVCGTLDEDRPLEEAYISCLEARKRDKLRTIPQDFDPSFPASEPEDEDGDDVGVKRRSHDSDDHDWLHGKMEDLHHEEARSRRRKRDQVSPRRYHSPPPKRLTSPPLQARGRSPRRGVAGRTSPRRLRSPAPFLSALVSPGHAKPAVTCFGADFAKSLPKPTGMLHHIRNGRRRTNTGLSMYHNNGSDVHVRGAIDIVKGLEQKRDRRREKFLAKYCDRARKGQLPERKVVPAGLGAEKMKEIGLLMAGKKNPSAFVLSV